MSGDQRSITPCTLKPDTRILFEVGFIPLDISDEESIGLVMMHADMLVQFGENQEPREPREELEPEESV